MGILLLCMIHSPPPAPFAPAHLQCVIIHGMSAKTVSAVVPPANSIRPLPEEMRLLLTVTWLDAPSQMVAGPVVSTVLSRKRMSRELRAHKSGLLPSQLLKV